jgi:hypothetical protein
MVLACGSSDDSSTTPGAPDATTGADAPGPGVDSSLGADTSVGSDAGAGADSTAPDDGGSVILPDAAYVDRGAAPPDVLIRVVNGCPFDLWIHAAGQEATLTPDNAHIASGALADYHAPLTWTAARVTAYLQAPNSSGQPQGEIDKVEATFGTSGSGEQLNTNITYVDWVGLPSEIHAFGTGNDCTTVGCYVPYAGLLQGCPSQLLSGQKCLSAGNYCSNPANQANAYCHALDPSITSCAQKYTDCAGASGATTPQAYACSGFFGGSPEYCAAVNRGVVDSPDAATPVSAFYKNAPFNTYSQWVHQRCPGIYAFPYDDYGASNESGYHACAGGTQLNVTFCPKG